MTLRSLFLLSLFLLSTVLPACSPAPQTPHEPAPVTETLPAPPEAAPTLPPAAEPTATPIPALWISPAVPDKLRVVKELDGIQRVENKDQAAIWLDVASTLESQNPNNEYRTSAWVYALVAAFPTLRDGVTFDELKAAWSGGEQALFLTESTFEAMKTLFNGEPGSSVEVLPAEGLTEALWQNRAAWGILPFEQLNPKLKVLELDGMSPLRKSFDPA